MISRVDLELNDFVEPHALLHHAPG